MSATTPQNQNNNQEQSPVTAQQILVKMIIDAQNNLNKLVAMQEQQIIYINMLINQVNNNVDQPTASVRTQEGTIKTTGEPTTSTGQPSDNKPISKKNKTV